MHIRVLLSKYRSYTQCPACQGARLKPDALLWRLGRAAAGAASRSMSWSAACGRQSPRCFDGAALPRAARRGRRPAARRDLRTRLGYLCDVGLGYLTLDRQSRTLSGGEVQRINLTTALGTSLVNTLFVLDEPSIGLHSARHGTRHRRDAAAARCRQHAAGGRARPADHARGRPPARPGSGRRRARRPHRLLRHAGAGRDDPASLTGAWLAGRSACRSCRCAAGRDGSAHYDAGDAPSNCSASAHTTSRTSTCASRCAGWCA